MKSTDPQTIEYSSSTRVSDLVDGIPSDDYYSNNVCTLLSFVVDRYCDVLHQDELSFASSILNLSSDARRMYARILSRRGPIFLDAQFTYREIRDTTNALNELESYHLIKRNSEISAETLFQKLTIGQVQDLFELQDFKSSKPVLISKVLETYTEAVVLAKIQTRFPWFELDQTERIALFSLLFFGDRYHDLSTFVIHDLGILRLEPYKLDSSNRQFKTRQEIDCYLTYWEFDEQLMAEDPIETKELLQFIELLTSIHSNRTLERQRSKLLYRMGRELERRGELQQALRVYGYSNLPPSRERQMRVLHRLGKLDMMENLRTTILETPWNIEEKLFAQKFKRKFKPQPKYNTKEQVLIKPQTDNIELIACREFEALGWKVWHLENQLPLALFGFVFWEWIYAPIPDAFINPFQIGPRDLYAPDFVETRRAVCVDPLNDEVSITQRMEHTFEQKFGIANPMIDWRVFDESLFETVVRCLGEDSICKVLQLMLPDLRQMRSGFPDLFVVKPDNTFEFVEVKGPTDQVRLNQRVWLEALTSVALPVRVLKYREAS